MVSLERYFQGKLNGTKDFDRWPFLRSQGPKRSPKVKNDIWYHWKDIFKGNWMALKTLTCDLFQGHRDLKGQKWHMVSLERYFKGKLNGTKDFDHKRSIKVTKGQKWLWTNETNFSISYHNNHFNLLKLLSYVHRLQWFIRHYNNKLELWLTIDVNSVSKGS